MNSLHVPIEYRIETRKLVMRTDNGFTLVELLIVIAIIGLLAAIAIPVFLNQRQRAWSAQSHSALRDAATALESFAVENGGDYSGANGQCAPSEAGSCSSGDDAILTQQGFKKSSLVKVQVRADLQSYCITAIHDRLDSGPPAHDWWVSTWHSDAPGPSDEDSCPGF